MSSQYLGIKKCSVDLKIQNDELTKSIKNRNFFWKLKVNIDLGVNKNELNRLDQNGRVNFLDLYIKIYNKEIIYPGCENKMDIDECLRIATNNHDIEMINYFIDKGANVNILFTCVPFRGVLDRVKSSKETQNSVKQDDKIVDYMKIIEHLIDTERITFDMVGNFNRTNFAMENRAFIKIFYYAQVIKSNLIEKKHQRSKLENKLLKNSQLDDINKDIERYYRILKNYTGFKIND